MACSSFQAFDSASSWGPVVAILGNLLQHDLPHRPACSPSPIVSACRCGPVAQKVELLQHKLFFVLSAFPSPLLPPLPSRATPMYRHVLGFRWTWLSSEQSSLFFVLGRLPLPSRCSRCTHTHTEAHANMVAREQKPCAPSPRSSALLASFSGALLHVAFYFPLEPFHESMTLAFALSPFFLFLLNDKRHQSAVSRSIAHTVCGGGGGDRQSLYIPLPNPEPTSGGHRVEHRRSGEVRATHCYSSAVRWWMASARPATASTLVPPI